MLQYECRGERLELLPERAIHWRKRRTLLVADTHFGKDACFRRAGIPIPPATMYSDLDRLGALVDTRAVERVIVLGDFIHARPDPDEPLWDALESWCAERPGLELAVVPGNHDRHGAGHEPRGGVRWLEETILEPPFVFRHEPVQDARGYVIAGHVHPVVRLKGPGRDRLRLPVFWFRRRLAVLPAFGEFTGGAAVRPEIGDRVIGAGPGGLMDLSRRENAHA